MLGLTEQRWDRVDESLKGSTSSMHPQTPLSTSFVSFRLQMEAHCCRYISDCIINDSRSCLGEEVRPAVEDLHVPSQVVVGDEGLDVETGAKEGLDYS